MGTCFSRMCCWRCSSSTETESSLQPTGEISRQTSESKQRRSQTAESLQRESLQRDSQKGERQQGDGRTTDPQQAGTQPSWPGGMSPRTTRSGTGDQPTTPQQEMEHVTIRGKGDITRIDLMDLEVVTTAGETDESVEISNKFLSFCHWLKDGPPYPRKVHLYTIRQYVGLKAHWALLNVGSIDDALCLQRFLKRNAGRYRKELSLCYLLDRPIFMTMGPSDALSAASSPEPGCASAIATLGSLCGQLAEFRANSVSPVIATIGGLVKLKGRLWAVTAKHAVPRSEEAPSMPATSSTDPGTDPGTNDPDEYDTESTESSHPLYVIEPRERMRAPAGAMPIQFEFAEEINTNLECRLIPVDKPDLMLPNRFRLEPDGPYKNVEMVELEPRGGKVAVLAGASGCHFMKMLREEVRLCLPSGKWVTMWALEPEEKGGLVMVQHGDSGSWVVDPERGSVFGIVIASTSYTVYLVPLKDVLDDQGLQEEWSLPKPEDVATVSDAARKKLGLVNATRAAPEASADNYKSKEKVFGHNPSSSHEFSLPPERRNSPTRPRVRPHQPSVMPTALGARSPEPGIKDAKSSRIALDRSLSRWAAGNVRKSLGIDEETRQQALKHMETSSYAGASLSVTQRETTTIVLSASRERFRGQISSRKDVISAYSHQWGSGELGSDESPTGISSTSFPLSPIILIASDAYSAVSGDDDRLGLSYEHELGPRETDEAILAPDSRPDFIRY